MKRFPKHYSDEILSYTKEGKGPSEIARLLNLKKVSVCRFLRRNGIKQPRPGQDNKDKIISLYQEGKTPREIGSVLNINHVTVNSLLNREGYYYNPFVHNEKYFLDINTPNKAYFAGFIAADGALVQNTNSKSLVLTISIHKKDREILECFKSELKCDHPIRNLKQRNYSMIRLAFCNSYINEGLLNLGITERKSLTLKNLIVNIPDPFKDAFVIGYFDGDGSITKHSLNGKTIQIRGTYDFLSGIKDYLGFGKIHYDGKTYVYRESRFENIIKFYSLYNNCDFYLKRKHEKFNECRTISSPYSSINRG